MVTVRALVPQVPDVFGDAPVIASDNRRTSFRIRAQVAASARQVADDGSPGRTISYKYTCIIRKRDVPPDAPQGWEPSSNDLFELAEADKVFVMTVEPAYPAKMSIRRPSGGYDGWRITLSDRQPTMSAASQYE